jgi:hypothetical protein
MGKNDYASMFVSLLHFTTIAYYLNEEADCFEVPHVTTHNYLSRLRDLMLNSVLNNSIQKQ